MANPVMLTNHASGFADIGLFVGYCNKSSQTGWTKSHRHYNGTPFLPSESIAQ